MDQAIPAPLLKRVNREAKKQGLTLLEFVHTAILSYLQELMDDGEKK